MLIVDFLDSLNLAQSSIFNRKSLKKLSYGINLTSLIKHPNGMLWSLYLDQIPLTVLSKNLDVIKSEWFMLFIRDDIPIFFFEEHLPHLDWDAFKFWFSRPISLKMGRYILDHNIMTLDTLLRKNLSLEFLTWLTTVTDGFWTLTNRQAISKNPHLPYDFIERYADCLCWEFLSKVYPKDAPIELYIMYSLPYLDFYHMLIHGGDYQEVLFDYFSGELIQAMYRLSQKDIDEYAMFNPHIRLEWWLLLLNQTDKKFNYNVVLNINPSPRCREIIDYVFYQAKFINIALNHSIPDQYIAFKIRNAPQEWNREDAIHILKQFRPISVDILMLFSDIEFHMYMIDHNLPPEVILDARIIDRMLDVNHSIIVKNQRVDYTTSVFLTFFIKYIPYVPNPSRYINIFEFYVLYYLNSVYYHSPHYHNDGLIKIASQFYFNKEYLDVFMKHTGHRYIRYLFENPFVEFEVYQSLDCQPHKEKLADNPFYLARRRELILSKLINRKIKRFLDEWYSPFTVRGIERLLKTYEDDTYHLHFKDNYRDTLMIKNDT